MRVFVAGASGAIGVPLVSQLIDRGHEVTGTFRSPGKEARLRAAGAAAVALDLLDPAAVRAAVLDAAPDAIIHQATALAAGGFTRKLDRGFAQTNRLRTEGTDALIAAARDAGVRRLVAQSFAPSRYARVGSMVKTEEDPLDPHPAAGTEQTNAAMAYLDQAVTDFGGIALRYGGFYGADNDGLVPPVRKRQFPIVASGAGAARSSISTTRPPRRSSPSSTTGRPSTTSSMTIPPRSGTGCRPSPRPWAPSRPGTPPPGWPGSSPARPA